MGILIFELQNSALQSIMENHHIIMENHHVIIDVKKKHATKLELISQEQIYIQFKVNISNIEYFVSKSAPDLFE